MKISELPTPRLRARAMELCTVWWSINEDDDLFSAFDWEKSEEGWDFWRFCEEGNWDRAKELQPSLFKPMDGKPHIKLVMETYCPDDEYITDCSLEITNWHNIDKDVLELINKYIYSVHPRTYITIQEAVEALYSFKREENQ